MLKSCADSNVAIRVTVHEQELNLTHGAGEDCGASCVVDRLVSSDDAVVGRRVRCVFVHVFKELLAILIDLAPEKAGGVHIRDGIINV